MNNQKLWQWREEMRLQPAVYEVTVLFEGTHESTGNIYDSREAAQIEVDWRNARRPRERARVEEHRVHNLDLSQRRWREPSLQSTPNNSNVGKAYPVKNL